MPLAIEKVCSETNDIGCAENCDIIPQWHVNSQGQLDSGVGIPRGQKLQMKYVAQIDAMSGGSITIYYKTIGFDPSGNEQLRFSING